MTDDSILDSLFHGCAWAAFLEQAAIQQGPPDPEATRLRAYRYYEEALAEKNARRQASQKPTLSTVADPVPYGEPPHRSFQERPSPRSSQHSD